MPGPLAHARPVALAFAAMPTEPLAIEVRAVERDQLRETGFDAALALERAANEVDSPWVPQRDVDEARALFTHDDPGLRFLRFAAWAEGRVVGSAFLSLPRLENVDKAMGVVVVHPEARRRGVGTALFARLVQVAKADGREVLLGDISLAAGADDTHPARAFAKAMGCERVGSETEQSLAVPMPEARLAQLESEVMPRLAGAYRLKAFHDGVDDALLPGLCEAMNRLNADTPSGEVDFDEETLTPERYRAALAAELEAGAHELMTLALTPSREVVAYAVVTVPGSSPEVAHEGGTFVNPAHRGHRLGLALRVAMVRALAKHAPRVTRVHSEISTLNTHRLAINQTLGAQVVAMRDLVARPL